MAQCYKVVNDGCLEVAKMVATCYAEKLHLKYNKPQIFTQFDPFL